MKRLIVVLVLIWGAIGYACQTEYDCDYGSSCTKSDPYATYGVCTGGYNPGNAHDKRVEPENAQYPAPSKKKGTKCIYDHQCDYGQTCVKGSGDIYGACM